MNNPPTYFFPDPRSAPENAPMAFGGDLSVGRLLKAYSMGIFPWYEEGEPVLWWCPDPRFVLMLDDVHINHGLRRELKKEHWKVTFDQAFTDVIKACCVSKRKGQQGTWITKDMIDAYTELHKSGYAHSVECWHDGALVGGLYGVSLGKAFYGESMFYLEPNASKVAFVQLIRRLKEWGFVMVDCQMETRFLASFGAEHISRSKFLDFISRSRDSMYMSHWVR